PAMSNHDREGSHSSNRDAALEHAWRDASDEQPPSHLDAAIIAAARKSVPESGKQPTTAPARVRSRNWLTQWQPLAAAATVAGLAFVLVQMLPREHDLAPSLQRKESAPVPAAAMPQPQSPSQSSAAREATANRQAPSADKTVTRPERLVVPDGAPAQVAVPAPSSAPASPTTTAEAAAGDIAVSPGESSVDRRQKTEPEMAGRTASATVAAPPSPAREVDFGKAAPVDAGAWAARIVALHASGDLTAAEDALRAFRAADPAADTYLPESLHYWSRTVE
ncbi:MAG: hypothetical protein WBM03_14910, partial [Steroidobacteraceae bacterium]